MLHQRVGATLHLNAGEPASGGGSDGRRRAGVNQVAEITEKEWLPWLPAHLPP
jgi:hypothetical protein